MKVVVDGIDDLVAIEEDTGATLHEFFLDFSQYMHENSRVVTTIDIDGIQSLYPLTEDVASMSVSSIAELAIFTISIKELCIQTLLELNANISKCIEEFKQTVEFVYEHKQKDARDSLAKAATSWKVCQNTLSMIVELQMSYISDKMLKDINDIYEELSNNFKEIAEANEKSDFGLLKDLIEYELLEKIDEVSAFSDKLRQSVMS